MSRLCHLYLEGQRLSAWQQHKGQLRQLATFANTPDGLAHFSAFLAVYRKSRFALLVNLPDEIFARERLPKLRGSERKQLLDSRSRRLFPDTAWRCAWHNGNGENGETDFLLMALANPAHLMPWLERLNAANAALESVHSLPQLLPALLQQHVPSAKSLLTLSLHDDAARFSLLIDGSLQNSRLAMLGPNSTLLDEYRRFVDHVSRQQPLDPLPALCVIAATERQEEIELPSIIKRIDAPEHNSTTLFLSIPYKQWPREQFAPPALRRQARQERQIDWLWRAAALSCLLGIGISLERLSQHAAAQAVIEQEQMLRLNIDNEIRQNDQQLVRSGLTRSQLQLMALDYPKFLDKQNAFEASLLALSVALDESPAIQLDSIDWKIEGFPPSTATMQLAARINSSDRRAAEPLLRQFHERLKQGHTASLRQTLPATTTDSGFPFALHTRQHEIP
jgi:hypothetical protein